MYFVDREKISQLLLFFEGQLEHFESRQEWSTPTEKAALERLTHTMTEAILDVGNAMIDGFIMRDPGSYEDIVDILDDEKVITEEMNESFKKIIAYRKLLVQRYTEVDHSALQQDFKAELPMLKQFPQKISSYLIDELGPVSAFKK
ncbi:HepT-like ribonuclease domain-containing protein [Mesobacillus harenae]|uniref:HepT-like ribonuclease domain-containing protein n=1 Tax=Mesobacillus harenae TaxID=2213203 RepID=UPI0015803B77